VTVMKILDEKIAVIENVHHEFSKIMKLERCRTCACLHTDMLAKILDTILDIKSSLKDDRRLTPVETDFSRWIENAEDVDLHH
jgi:hypothetical protein